MTDEPMTEFERQIASAPHAYADDAELRAVREPGTTERPMRRFPLLPVVAATLLVVAVGVGAIQLLSMSASRGSEARVNGATYSISIARSLVLDDDDVSPIGELEASDQPGLFADLTAYAIDGVDPDDALVVRAAPGQRDDAGPYGEWILLMRGEIRAGDVEPLCPYFDPTSEHSPPECRNMAP